MSNLEWVDDVENSASTNGLYQCRLSYGTQWKCESGAWDDCGFCSREEAKAACQSHFDLVAYAYEEGGLDKVWEVLGYKPEPTFTKADLEAARREAFDWLLERFIDLYENEQNPEPENIWQECLKSLEGREG